MTELRRHAQLPPSPPTFPAWFPALRLDRIAFSGCRLRGAVRRQLTPVTRRASDHLPISADLFVDQATTAAASANITTGAVPAGAP
jgi:endonuclease/exonuclease/phosphatase family metal-dependent hydrolase